MTRTRFAPLLLPTLTLLLSLAPLHARAQDAEPAVRQALVQRVLSLWHVENMAVSMAQKPALDAFQQARVALQGRVNQEKQDAAMKDIAADIQRYTDYATPLAREIALDLKSSTLAPLLYQNFTADDLRQLIAILESPVKKKFEQLAPAMEKAYGEKVAARAGPTLNPRLEELAKTVGARLRAAAMAP